MSNQSLDVLAVMEADASGLRDWRTSDAAREIVAELIRASRRTVSAFEAIGRANGVVPTLQARGECEAALVAQKEVLVRIGGAK